MFACMGWGLDLSDYSHASFLEKIGDFVMAYATPEPKKILALMPDGHDRRFYPYPKENITPKGINEIVRSAPNFGFIVQNCEAIYGNATGGHFTPARRQAEG